MSRHVKRWLSAFGFSVAASAQAITLADMYKLGPTERMWYLAGQYDAALTAGPQARSACLEAMRPDGYMKVLADFVQALPADPATPQRKAYDGMNVALISSLVLDRTCPGK
jgi:hypothetical protein